jgi:cellulose biosynthesis protein BcsQ
MEYLSEVSVGVGGYNAKRARVTAVWSPAGGTGKTTVALSFAASRISAGRQTVYLSLENFSSTSVYFKETGASISKLYEKLESNAYMFQKGIRQIDTASGIAYFCGPENYDDVNILSAEDIEKLINACAEDSDELVVDLSSQCDRRNQTILCLADIVLLVCDPSLTSQAKLRQFIHQNNIFEKIRANTILVNNKGARYTDPNLDRTVSLPAVNAAGPGSVFMTLSGGRFDW